MDEERAKRSRKEKYEGEDPRAEKEKDEKREIQNGERARVEPAFLR